MKPKNKLVNRGIIELIVVIIMALVILNVLNIDIKDILAKESVHQFALYVKDMLILVWNDLLEIFRWAKGV